MKKKILIPIVALVAIGGFAAYQVTAVGGKPQATIVDTYPAEYTDLSNTISVTGMVESDNSVNVYSTLSNQVKEVLVEVGDTVEEGELLCVLDTADLEATIAQNQATLAAAQAKANHNLAVAEKDRETHTFNTEGDYNANLLQAEAAVENARNNVRKMENTVREYEQDLRDLREDRKQAADDETYDEAITRYQRQLIDAEVSLEGAQLQLEQAEATLRAAKMQDKESAVNTEDAVTTAKLNTNFNDQWIAINKLREDVGKAQITAPVSGTITAVMATEGAAGTGILFVIEDTNSLKVVTKIKEYDVGAVQEGMPVSIKADGTGEEEFDGVLSKIAPTTVKDNTGNTVDTTSAEFPAEVKVTSASSLRIGMNARMNIITEEKKNVLTVPFESITEDEEGQTAVFIMEEQEDGTHVARKVPVTTGMETDFFSEVTGDGLKEGDLIISDPEGLEDGALVTQLDLQAVQQQMTEEAE